MFKRLRTKWKVNTGQLILILCTFAIGGSLCGRAGAWVLDYLLPARNVGWWALYFIVVTVLWPFSVLLVSLPLGQFRFFKQYLQKMGARLTGRKKQPANLAVFASGSGSNALKIIEHFNQQPSPTARVVVVVCNNPQAAVIEKAKAAGLPVILIPKGGLQQPEALLQQLMTAGVHYLVLAGFLLKIPPALLNAYPNRILNLHPALLPAFGGKGMYGLQVHQAVLAAGVPTTGITIHLANEQYDAGTILFQATCAVLPADTPESLAARVQQLEHQHFARVIEQWIRSGHQLSAISG